MPPRHGKSELTSKYFPAWWLGNQPDSRVILASYEAKFAASWGRKVRDLLQSPIGATMGVKVRNDSKASDGWNLQGRDGGMMTAGVGGPATGKGAHLFLIDDPVKNAEEAQSPTYRNRNWDWYTSTAYTRLEPGSVVVLIQTRWHQDDLGGRILSHAQESGEKWTVLSLPALAEPGDLLGRQPGQALWPERFSVERLQSIRRTVGGYYFSALYQQQPTPASGGAFQRQWFKYHRPTDQAGILRLDSGSLVTLAESRRFGVLDLAFSTRKEADYTVLGGFAADPASNLLVMDLVRARMEAPQLVPLVRSFVERNRLAYVCVEANGAQLAIVQALRNAGVTVRSLRAEQDKITRSLTAQVRCESGQIFLPWGASWLPEFEAELLSFPKSQHDDQVDVLSYAALEVFRFGGAPEPEDQKRARQVEEARQASDAYHSPDNDRWWD
jgi:predicted phage terminase large subunit-like protein